MVGFQVQHRGGVEMDLIKDVINRVTDPTISFTFLLAVFFIIFPPNNLLLRLNRKLGLDKLWTDAGAIIFLVYSLSL